VPVPGVISKFQNQIFKKYRRRTEALCAGEIGGNHRRTLLMRRGEWNFYFQPHHRRWIALLVLRKIVENDKKIKKIKTLRFPYIIFST
jgi:hypothetical protein